MQEEAVGEEGDGLFDTFAEFLADAAALLDGLVEILLQEGGFGIGSGVGEAAAMEEAAEEGEIGEAAFAGEDGIEVEFEVGLAADALGVAEEAELAAVGCEAVEVFLFAVEEVLEEGVGGEARASASGGLR